MTPLLALSVLYWSTLVSCTENAPPQASEPNYITQEALSLADACKITALMNDDKWDEVEKVLGTKAGLIAELRRQSGIKDWPGIGAYRGSRIDKDHPRVVTHRFGFAPRTNPHEIWIDYMLTETGISKPGLMVMGW